MNGRADGASGVGRTRGMLARAVVPTARLVAIALAIGVPMSQWIVLAIRFNPEDVTSYLWAGEAWLTLGNPYAPADELIGFNPIYRYAPWFAVPWIWLSTLPQDAVGVGWTVLMVACAVAAVVPLFRAFGMAALPLGGFMLGWLLAIALQGNVQPAIVAALVWGLNTRFGPLVIAACASLKYTPILYVLVYVGRRDWRRATVTLGLTFALLGPMLLFEIPSLAFSTSGWPSLLRDAPLVWLLLLLVACVSTLWLARGRWSWPAAGLAVTLAFPRAFNYDVTFLLPGVAEAKTEDRQR